MTWSPHLFSSQLWLALLAAYVVGSIPFGLVVAKIKQVNLRAVGSGNIGATNVYRALGLGYAVLVFVLDGAKGVLATLLGMALFSEPWLHVICGSVSLIGHSYSFLAGFRGGKGAATGLGVLLALCPWAFVIDFLIAVVFISWTRYVAPVTLFCSALTPFLLLYFQVPTPYTIVVSVLCLFIFLRHFSNIKRLLQGNENKI